MAKNKAKLLLYVIFCVLSTLFFHRLCVKFLQIYEKFLNFTLFNSFLHFLSFFNGLFVVVLQKKNEYVQNLHILQNTKTMKKNEIVIYQPDNTTPLEVLLKKETIWLNQKLMAKLFDCSVYNVHLHLKNIFKENELDENSVIEESSITASDGKSYKTKHYNLDAIIAVGYRVNSKRATAFRQWATGVLRDYMLKGYAINQRIERLEYRVFEHDKQIEVLVQQALPPKQGVFFDGQMFDAYAFVSDLIKSAKKSIVLIDNYVDESVLLLLSKRKKNVPAKILTANFDKVLKQDLSKHNAQYPPIKIEKFTKSHDRFLFIDDDIFHIGASLKDLGKKWFAFSKMETNILSMLIKEQQYL